MNPDTFIQRWRASGAAERANYQLFFSELCDLLGVPPPQPQTADPRHNAYVFEKAVPLPHGSTGFIDLYKRGCFVLEAKQGSDRPDDDQAPFSAAELRARQRRKRGTAVRGTAAWDTAMEKARQQAQRYVRNLPPDEIEDGRPPFIIVVDVGATIALYAEFSRTVGNYIPFPDPSSYRLSLEDLADANVRTLLRQVWLEPMALDPARRSARVTREIASRLAQLARSLEGDHPPDLVAQFLMRCLFTMFAEDVNLLPSHSFTQLLADIRHDPANFKTMLEHLWTTMDSGGFSVILRQQLPRFNGNLFAQQTALPLNADQIQLLIEAAQADWRDVEPAIFGTLLERALDPVERHKLGAHYTPRAYVERLVKPTVIDPLRAEWESVQVAAAQLAEREQIDKALAEVSAFQKRLAALRILDPACGSGNFLYVTLEHLKRLEGEVLNTLQELGQGQLLLEIESVMVTPEQFLGIEVNPRAAAIAELVLWIGYLQWHVRTRGDVPLPEPIIRDFRNIECRDAVLDWDEVTPLLDEAGQPVTRWDGRSTKPHPVTGQEVPDENARIPAYRYHNPRPAAWPDADFIVGNPPFIGTALMRDALGDGYTEAIRGVYAHVPASADYVMFWWDKAAELVRRGGLQRFGLITTNSLRQTFNRRVLQHHMEAKEPLSLVFAIPNHPWVDSAEGAAVRISMTVAEFGEKDGVLRKVTAEQRTETDEASVRLSESRGKIQPDLTIGANVAGVLPLEANSNLSSRGVQLIGAGFIVTPEEAEEMGLGRVPGLEKHIRQYRNGRDITATPRGVMVIDLFGLEVEEVRQRFPEVYQWIYERVKPQRDQNNRASYRNNWWIHGEPRSNFRPTLEDLSRYIATVETSKHRFFIFLNKNILPDNMLVNIALDDAYFLGVLSSRIHLAWVLASGGTLEDRPRYNKSRCFDPFPFPDATEAQKQRIRELAEQLDAHRKRQQAQHPKLTLTDMYNVLEKLRVGASLTAKEKQVHEQGLVSILRQLHEELDTAVFAAYNWPPDLSDEEILSRLVALNAERATEEAQGQVRWLRPAYQAPDEVVQPHQAALLETAEPDTAPTLSEKQSWPGTIAERARAVRAILAAFDAPATPRQVAGAFQGRRSQSRIAQVADILDTLAVLGQAEEGDGGVFTAV